MSVKFITINTWFGGILWDELVEFIKNENPDILCLQEVYDGKDQSHEKRFRTVEEYKKIFSGTLPHFAFGATVFDTGINAEWGNAIFSKFQITSSQTIFFDLPYSHYDFQLDADPRLAAEGVLVAEVKVGDKNIFIGSWHGVWDHHGGDTDKRHIMEEKIINGLKDKGSIILAGDTNMNPTSNVIQNIQNSLNLESVFGTTLKSTFNMPQKKNPGNYANSPVDMVFVSRDIEIRKKEMPNVNISDHYPLVVELEV